MKNIESCSFFGHSEINVSDNLITRTTLEIEKVLISGCRLFYFGGLGRFDWLCHKIVTSFMQKYNGIKRIFCLIDERHLNIKKKPKYLRNNDYEDFVYFTTEYYGFYKRIYFRNCEIINNSDFIIFYVEEREESGAYKTFKHAQKKKKSFINLF